MTNSLPVAPLLPPGPGPGVDLLRVLGTVSLLLGAAWIGLHWVRQRPWMVQTLRQRMRLRVEETRPLGNRSHLHLVVCGDQQFLVASSPAGVSLIADLLPSDPAQAVADPSAAEAFGKVLQAESKASNPSPRA